MPVEVSELVVLAGLSDGVVTVDVEASGRAGDSPLVVLEDTSVGALLDVVCSGSADHRCRNRCRT